MDRFSGTYPKVWKEISSACYEAVGHRCIRCEHPYVKGKYGAGEWTPCDDQCHHKGPLKTVLEGEPEKPIIYAQWRILTCHHFDNNKSNCAWWNLLALCQRCHLQIQGKVIPDNPYFFSHSEWIKPYVGGFYAKKYLGEELTREEVMGRLNELLALELRAA